MKKTNQQGFTLIELSIVLVIIGLLIGGILAAQSMINTTKIQAFARQIGQFDAAVVNFKDKYGGLPGDTSIISGAVAGNGDNGLIEDADTPAYNTMAGEMANFWPNLSTSGMKSESGAAYNATYSGSVDFSGAGTNIPKSKLGTNSTGVIAHYATTLTSGNYYSVCDVTATSGAALSCAAGIAGADALAVDVKLDDGAGLTGTVNGGGATTVTGSMAAVAVAGYTVGTNAILRARIGSQAGTLE